MAGDIAKSYPFSEEDLKLQMDKDNITKDWIMVASPVPMLLVLLLYGLVVSLGPRIMDSRAPFKLKTIMRLYNVFQVFHNIYMIYSVIEHPQGLPRLLKNTCTLIDTKEEDHGTLSKAFLYYSWNYLLSKHIDLLDTIFMVLRKRNSHITFLHVYHHVAMVFFTWFTLSYTKSHHAVIPGLINVFVHSIMYTYYFLATFNRFKGLLWWKQHLTKLQLGQFVVILLYIILLHYYECPMSRIFTFTWAFNVFVILVLFINFYVKSYVRKTEGRGNKSQVEQDRKNL